MKNSPKHSYNLSQLLNWKTYLPAWPCYVPCNNLFLFLCQWQNGSCSIYWVDIFRSDDLFAIIFILVQINCSYIHRNIRVYLLISTLVHCVGEYKMFRVSWILWDILMESLGNQLNPARYLFNRTNCIYHEL